MMVWMWRVRKGAMQHPFWTPPFARSPAWPCSFQRLAVGNPPNCYRRGVPVDDARTKRRE